MALGSRQRRTYVIVWTAFWAVVMAILIFASLHFTDGRLIYSIDDPYIHLSVAENILKGGYGVNAGEVSSPASSIIYPFLLAGTIAIGLGSLGPMILNVAAAGLSVWLLLDYFWRQALPADAQERPLYFNLAAPLLMLSISAFALPLTGMEHSLHILAVIVAMRGLVAVLDGAEVPLSMIAATCLMPFLRFEGVPLAVAIVIVLVVDGHWRSGLLIGAVILAGFAAYALFMVHMGLPLIPSSILTKMELAVEVQSGANLAVVTGLVRNTLLSIFNRWGVLLALVVCALLAVLQDRDGKWRRLTSPQVLCGFTVGVGVAAQVVGGRYGAFFRYEVYAVAIALMGGIYLLRPFLHALHRHRLTAAQIGLVAALFVLMAPFDTAAMQTMRASRNIYEQQYQMHRFATEFFPRRVAVNDLGMVSYRNDNFVLDLWGLSSEKSRHLRMTGQLNAATMERMVREAGVDYAMIFQSWFDGVVPQSWCLMAVMESEQVVADSKFVHFYATNADAIPAMAAALDRFARAIPKRVILRRYACAGR